MKGFARRQLQSSIRSGVRFAARQLRDPKNADLLSDLLGGLAPGPDRNDDAGKPVPVPARTPADRAQARRTSGEYVGTRKANRSAPKQRFPKRPDGGYPGDYTGTIKPQYSPDLDGDADPGEIVWGWVPYEEDHTQGKDRPVLVVGRDGKWLLVLMLTSQDNIPGARGEVREDEHGTRYINVGSGDWDSQGRPSEVRLDRIIRIDPHDVRREGAIMPMALFSTIVDAIEV